MATWEYFEEKNLYAEQSAKLVKMANEEATLRAQAGALIAEAQVLATLAVAFEYHKVNR
jgi:hypothetical protein